VDLTGGGNSLQGDSRIFNCQGEMVSAFSPSGFWARFEGREKKEEHLASGLCVLLGKVPVDRLFCWKRLVSKASGVWGLLGFRRKQNDIIQSASWKIACPTDVL